MLFHYNTISDPFLGIGYIYVSHISCSCSACLVKMASPWNRSQDKYNHYRCKGENKNYIYWPILRSYNNWQIIYYIASRKKKSTETDTNVHIKQNAINNIALNTEKYISNNDYGEN